MTQSSEPPVNLVIEALYILENESGICIFEENYIDITKDGTSIDLISSFLSAILSFAGEAFTDEIQHIKFSNRKMLFEFSDKVLYVVFINDNAPATDFQIKKTIARIAEQFSKKYGHIVESGNYMNVELFEDFSEDLYQIVKKEPLSLKILQFMDFRDHIEKIGKFITDRTANFIKQKDKIDDFFYRKKKKRDSEKRVKKLIKEAKNLEDKLEK